MELNKQLLLNLFGPADFENKWVYDLGKEEYHADKTAINSSSLKWMLKSPNAFYRSFFEGRHKEPTESMKYGTLCHMAILEGRKFKERHIVIPDFGDQRTKINKEKKKTFLDEVSQSVENPVFVEQDDFDKIIDSIDALLSHKEASKLLSNGVAEVTGYFICPITGLRKKMQIDFLSYNVHCQVDVKTTKETEWEFFRRSFESYRYDFQMAFYDHGIEVITKKAPEHTAIVAIDNQFPYEVEVYEVDEMYKLTGKYDYIKCSEKLKECILKNDFQRKNKEIMFTEMSHWMKQKYQLLGVL